MFPSAVLVGAPAGPTRVISIAAYEAAFEQYDYSLASAVAMIMGFVQLVDRRRACSARGACSTRAGHRRQGMSRDRASARAWRALPCWA